jgi:capsule polysaccharide export protein KpsE/RkpR
VLAGAEVGAWFWEAVERTRPKAVPKEKAVARLAAINRFVIIIILFLYFMVFNSPAYGISHSLFSI